MKIIQTQQSAIDNVTKYIIEDSIFGKNEVSVIRKDTKNIIVLPSQTNCKMGCKFCHLTGTTRPVKNLTVDWFANVINLIIENDGLLDDPLLISFMGAGEPLNNIDVILDTIKLWAPIPTIRFALATMMPNMTSFYDLLNLAIMHPTVSLKTHLSVHGTFNRGELINSSASIHSVISVFRQMLESTDNPIEYHYTLVKGVNDSVEELEDFKRSIQYPNNEYSDRYTVKFLSLSECDDYKKSDLTEEQIRNIFSGITVEFYDPPGRDVGSSCGMFDRSIYMETK